MLLMQKKAHSLLQVHLFLVKHNPTAALENIEFTAKIIDLPIKKTFTERIVCITMNNIY